MVSLAACGADAARTPGEGGPTLVSLNPCLDAILVEVAEPHQILALSHYSRDPAASSMDVALAKRFGVTGGTAEEIIALKPDIVLASSFIAPATHAALERAGMRVETFGSPASVTDSMAQVRALAGLTGQRQAGEALAHAIATTPAQPAGDTWSAMLWQPGQIVAGDASLVGEHLRWAGLTNHAAARGLGQADFVALEDVLADPPQLLLVAGDASGQTHPLLTDQRKTMHVARFDPALFYCGGPSIIAARTRLLDIRAELEARP